MSPLSKATRWTWTGRSGFGAGAVLAWQPASKKERAREGAEGMRVTWGCSFDQKQVMTDESDLSSVTGRAKTRLDRVDMGISSGG